MTELFHLQDSAVNMDELEEALVIVKQRKEENNPELHFLHKVDEEKNKGIVSIGYLFHCAFSALTLLVGWQEGHPASKN